MSTLTTECLDREVERMHQERVPELFALAVTFVKQSIACATDDRAGAAATRRAAITALNIIVLLEAIRTAEGCPENTADSLARVGMIVSDDIAPMLDIVGEA